jgi:hypothetical protein
MSATVETKVCPYCAETIKAAAKKCPFCNSRMARYDYYLHHGAAALACLISFGCLAFVAAWVFPGDSSKDGRSFARHRSDLNAKDVAVKIEDGGTSGHYYYVSGVVTNSGEFPWRVENFELTISNAQGIADVIHAEVKDAFVVQPHADHGFIFQCRTVMTNTVIAAQARVENARDGNMPEKGD